MQDRAWVFDKYAPDLNQNRKLFLEKFLPEYIQNHNCRTALDLGCGLGYFSEILANLGLTVTGTDARIENLQEAKKRYPDISFQFYNVEEAPGSETIASDIVLCYGLLYHLENPFRAIRNIRKLTNKLLIISSMVAPYQEPIAYLINESHQEDQSLNFVSLVPSQACMVRMLYAAGFAAVYRPRHLPAHEQYRESSQLHQQRTILLASTTPLSSSELLLLEEQVMLGIQLWQKDKSLVSYSDELGLSGALHMMRRGLHRLKSSSVSVALRHKVGRLLRGAHQQVQETHMSPIEVRWRTLAEHYDHVDIDLQPGVKMRLHTDSILSHHIYCENFEWQERAFVNAFLREGDVFVDVGAHVGLFALTAAFRVGSTGQVYAFEPSLKNYLRLKDNVALNQFENVSSYQMALSSNQARVKLVVSLDGYDAWNSLAQPVAGHTYEVEEVDTTTWDDFAEQHDLLGRVAMMKIDVEGWEQHVLAGGQKAFSSLDAPVLQVEFTDVAAQAGSSSCQELYSFLQSFGYRLFVYDASSNQLREDPLRENYPYLNLIAIKNLELALNRLNHK